MKPKITIIISYYKALTNLQLTLQALQNQSFMDFEVILSEDDANDETKKFLSENKSKYSFEISHTFQKLDQGFRKNEMLNKSIQTSRTDKLVFIDGDCIPHRHFAKNYVNQIIPGYICEGRAVMLGPKFTQNILQSLTINDLSSCSLFWSDSNKLKDGIYFPYFPLSFKPVKGLVGRNWAVCKQDLLAVNGFDMDYIYAGVGEDVDIEWRLKASGLKSKSMKNKAIIYHLYHPKSYSEDKVQKNYELCNSKQKENHVKCLNGLQQLVID